MADWCQGTDEHDHGAGSTAGSSASGGLDSQVRKQQCRMACGGEAPARALTPSATWRGLGAGGSGARGRWYRAVSSMAGSVSAEAWSLCCPWRQCSAQRLANDGSIDPTMSSQSMAASVIDTLSVPIDCTSATTGMTIPGFGVPATDSPGQAYAATANCANSTTPISMRQIVSKNDRFTLRTSQQPLANTQPTAHRYGWSGQEH